MKENGYISDSDVSAESARLTPEQEVAAMQAQKIIAYEDDADMLERWRKMPMEMFIEMNR
ncbi:MAG: hypothetical protein LBB23_00915 [Rickettsiales bacterium]|jgi:hypothetical protein|nr:hypothetical protein [Rickettsiales bacterium]